MLYLYLSSNELTKIHLTHHLNGSLSPLNSHRHFRPHHRRLSPDLVAASSLPSSISFIYSRNRRARPPTRWLPCMFHFRPSFADSQSCFSARPGRCHASSQGPQMPPKLDPPDAENKARSSGALSTFSSLQDSVRIFLAVLFWMSLFFWSCVWDGGNDSPPNKKSQFRK